MAGLGNVSFWRPAPTTSGGPALGQHGRPRRCHGNALVVCSTPFPAPPISIFALRYGCRSPWQPVGLEEGPRCHGDRRFVDSTEHAQTGSHFEIDCAAFVFCCFFFNHRVFCVCVWRGASISSQSSEELRLADEKIRLNRQGSRLLLADGLLVSTGSTTGFHDPC